MTTYVLDTNIVSYLADPSSPFHERVADAILALPEEDRLAISVLTLYELSYGHLRSSSRSRLLAIVHDEQFAVLTPTEDGSAVFARLKNAYRLHTGMRERELVRHNVDLILASVAIVEGAVLVSNDGLFATLATLEPRLAV